MVIFSSFLLTLAPYGAMDANDRQRSFTSLGSGVIQTFSHLQQFSHPPYISLCQFSWDLRRLYNTRQQKIEKEVMAGKDCLQMTARPRISGLMKRASDPWIWRSNIVPGTIFSGKRRIWGAFYWKWRLSEGHGWLGCSQCTRNQPSPQQSGSWVSSFVGQPRHLAQMLE